MIYKPSLVLFISVIYSALSIYPSSPLLLAQDTPIIDCLPVASSSVDTTSNLVTNNPFVPKNNGPLNESITPSGPKSITNTSQVLQKYLEFMSIAIINKKKYFSIFNKRTNDSFWISEGETVDNFRVTYYNRSNNTISITDGINSEVIPIITANETPLSIAGASYQIDQEVAEPQIPGATASKNKDKPSPPKRRRVIPVKR